MAPADLNKDRGQGGNWEISAASPRNLEGSHLLHQLPQLPTSAIPGAGALCGDHSCADAFPVRGLGRGVQLPAFLWALEEGLWEARGQRMGDSAIPTRGERKPGKKTDALYWTPGICQTMCHVSDKMGFEGLRNLVRNYGIRALPQDRNLFSHTHLPTCNTASVTTIRNRPAHTDTQTWTSLSASPARVTHKVWIYLGPLSTTLFLSPLSLRPCS